MSDEMRTAGSRKDKGSAWPVDSGVEERFADIGRAVADAAVREIQERAAGTRPPSRETARPLRSASRSGLDSRATALHELGTRAANPKRAATSVVPATGRVYHPLWERKGVRDRIS